MNLTKKITLLALLSGYLTAFSVQAEKGTGAYLSGKLGMSVQRQYERDLSLADGKGGSLSLKFSNENKSIFSGGVALGYDFKPELDVPVRMELEYIARSRGEASNNRHVYPSDHDTNLTVRNTTRVATQTVMVNGYYDIDTGSPVTPYLTVGAGMAYNKLHNRTGLTARTVYNGNPVHLQGQTPSASDCKTNFAWSIGTGANYAIDQNWSLGVGYRFVDAGRVSTNFSGKIESSDAALYVKGGSRVKTQYHDIHAGVTYRF